MRLLTMLLGLLLLLPPSAHAGDELRVKVFRVFDGDGLLVRTRSHSERVRLAGIDAPELQQPGGAFSQKVLENMVGGRRVVIEVVGENAAGESLVRMQLAKYDIALEMVKAGAAWAGPDASPELRAAETGARAEGKGIWGAPTAPIPPWQWRMEQDEAAQ